MITLTKQPIATLDPKTGKTTGIERPPKKVDIGMPTHEFHKQVMDMANKKVPLEKTLSAIEKHPDITDKARAKSMASAVYKIIGKK